MGSVGFKEWAVVGEALGRGEQTILLRKGGIAEGREGFSFRSPEFLLFPTFFHEQIEKVRAPVNAVPVQRAGEIELKFFARLECAANITDWEVAAKLEPFHILLPEVVRERFEYEAAPGIHAAFVRIFRLAPTWIVPDLPSYGGCRSWVKLPDLPEPIQLTPVLSDAESGRSLRAFREIVADAAPVLAPAS
ncbi:MAG: DUF1802 family protein [Verrucomicrobiota bacterium]|nr:DUF1802 family protein [Verrucomicrobiota bacterium]